MCGLLSCIIEQSMVMEIVTVCNHTICIKFHSLHMNRLNVNYLLGTNSTLVIFVVCVASVIKYVISCYAMFIIIIHLEDSDVYIY